MHVNHPIHTQKYIQVLASCNVNMQTYCQSHTYTCANKYYIWHSYLSEISA